MIYGNIFWVVKTYFFDQNLLISSIYQNITSKDENVIAALMLTSKINIASQGNLSQYPEKIVRVLSLGRFNGVMWKMLTVSLWEFPAAPKSLLFELFSFATSVCQCYMNMWSIQQSNLTTLMDNLIKLKQRLDKLNKKND